MRPGVESTGRRRAGRIRALRGFKARNDQREYAGRNQTRHDEASPRLQLRDDAVGRGCRPGKPCIAALGGCSRSFAGKSALKTWVYSPSCATRSSTRFAFKRAGPPTSPPCRTRKSASLDDSLSNPCSSSCDHWTRQDERPPQLGRPRGERCGRSSFWEVFDACLKHLPENTARVFMMREFLEFETAEVCQELSLTTSNCNVILHRARNGLRKCLRGSWFSDRSNDHADLQGSHPPALRSPGPQEHSRSPNACNWKCTSPCAPAAGTSRDQITFLREACRHYTKSEHSEKD
jgi:RNA polymerase sigma-70 factor (ECF subfamily)